jgi:L-ribulokinase
MGKVRREVYTPVPENSAIYDELYAEYVTLHDYFGRGGNDVLHRLRALRDRIIESPPQRDAADDSQGDTTSEAFYEGTGDSR